MQMLLLNPQNKTDRRKIEKILKSKRNIHIVDEIQSQFEELFHIRNPKKLNYSKQELMDFIDALIEYKNSEDFGYWVYYPWNNYFVHYLPEALHQELRTARNRNLITISEQEKFYKAVIGIAGLSVGNSAVASIVYSGGGRELRLADHDILSGSNINRIRTAFYNIGQKKTEIIAREVYSVNPFSNLILYPEGVNLNNLEKFLIFPKPLNVLVEEMDNLYLKVQIRLLARKYRIPVVMVTDNGDNILIDIERYDMNPNRTIFNSKMNEEEFLAIPKEIPKAEAARIIARIVGEKNIASRMELSLKELGKTLFSWPQLGTAAMMGGCVIAYCVRKIILQEQLKEGKYILSLDELLLK